MRPAATDNANFKEILFRMAKINRCFLLKSSDFTILILNRRINMAHKLHLSYFTHKVTL